MAGDLRRLFWLTAEGLFPEERGQLSVRVLSVYFCIIYSQRSVVGQCLLLSPRSFLVSFFFGVWS